MYSRKLFELYAFHRTAIRSSLTVAGIALVGADDPCLVVPEFEDLRA
jgi:hypothetical protein